MITRYLFFSIVKSRRCCMLGRQDGETLLESLWCAFIYALLSGTFHSGRSLGGASVDKEGRKEGRRYA